MTGPTGACLQALLLTVSLLVAGGANTQPVNGQRFGDWKIGCEHEDEDADAVCYLYWSSVPDTDPMMHVAVAQEPEAAIPSLRVQIPLGIRLESPVAISAGETSRPIEVRYCLEHGCHGVVELDAELTEALRGSMAAKITFSVDAQTPIAVTIPMAGFADGLETLLQPPASAPQAEPASAIGEAAARDE